MPHARHAATWLRELVKQAKTVPTLPALPAPDPAEQVRKTQAAKDLFDRWRREDEFRYRRRA